MLKIHDWVDISTLNWCYLSENCNAVLLLEKNKNKINWEKISKNQNAIELLKKNQNKINWNNLSSNSNAIELLKKNQEKINWFELSKNENAIELLKENQDKIDWYYFSKNPNIFTYDYKLMKETMKNSGIAEELMSVIFHPKNMNKWIDWGFSEHQEFMDLIDE